VNRQLAVEVTFLGGAVHFGQHGGHHHHTDKKEAHAVDQHLQVGLVWQLSRGNG